VFLFQGGVSGWRITEHFDKMKALADTMATVGNLLSDDDIID
jgi:hypothetical protein